MGYADDWFLHPLISEWERKMVAEGMDIEKKEAKRLAEDEKLPIEEVVEWCSEGREKRKIADRFGFENEKVIEIGSGRGYYTQFLAREGKTVCALDKMVGGRENHMWDEFKEVMKGHDVWNKLIPIQPDAREIPVPDYSFDIATCASFFRDLYPEGIQREIIEEMARVSRGLRIAVHVDKDLDKGQQNYYDQLKLRKKAQRALDLPKEHRSHTPFKPTEVKRWFEDVIEIKDTEYIDPQLKGGWGGNVDHYVEELGNSHPEKEELVNELEGLNSDIEEYGCKLPTIMLIWA